jgi:hypothetical protein
MSLISSSKFSSKNEKNYTKEFLGLIVMIVCLYLIAGLFSVVKVSGGHNFVGSGFWTIFWQSAAKVFFHC